MEKGTYTLRRKEEVLVVYLDIGAAYDTFWHSKLLQKLRITTSILFGFLDYIFYTRKKCRELVGEAEEECSPECRLPQGSTISPTLFLVFISDLLSSVSKREGMRVHRLADDIFCGTKGVFDGESRHQN